MSSFIIIYYYLQKLVQTHKIYDLKKICCNISAGLKFFTDIKTFKLQKKPFLSVIKINKLEFKLPFPYESASSKRVL